MRTLIALLLVAPTGCLPAGFRVGMPPVDRQSREVRNSLLPLVPNALKSAARAAAPPGTVPEFRGETCSSSSGEQEWYVDVRYVRPDGAATPTDLESCARALTTGRDAVTRGMLDTSAANRRILDAPNSEAGENKGAFVVSYTRRNGAVGGEVVGAVSPSTTYAGFTRLKVVASEWCTE